MITLVILMSLVVIVMVATVNSMSVFDLSKFGPVSNTIEISRDTPDAILADQMCKGNISRDAYELFVAEKLDLKLT